VEESQAKKQFAEMLARPDEGVDLARAALQAALLIGAEEYPELEPPRYVARLDRMGEAVRGRLPGSFGVGDAAEALNGYLFGEEGFHGNEQDYYDPRNSFLNEVLDRKTGIPITLSTVYLEVARRAGVEAAGVGLPGHFIVKVSADGEDLLVDPYHQGLKLSEEDCQDRLDRIYGGRLRLDSTMLAPCGTKSILARTLRNLKAIYLKTGEQERALRVLDLLLEVNPHSGEDVRDRGLLYAALDCYGLAAEDLQSFVDLFPGAPETPELREKVTEYRGKAARVN
jgi:regulator of sirC expression with transglutaminase-like and TPR domain